MSMITVFGVQLDYAHSTACVLVHGLLYEFNLLWSINLLISMTFRPVSYGPCSHTGVPCVLAQISAG